jgi:hypothetical protein
MCFVILTIVHQLGVGAAWFTGIKADAQRAKDLNQPFDPNSVGSAWRYPTLFLNKLLQSMPIQGDIRQRKKWGFVDISGNVGVRARACSPFSYCPSMIVLSWVKLNF